MDQEDHSLTSQSLSLHFFPKYLPLHLHLPCALQLDGIAPAVWHSHGEHIFDSSFEQVYEIQKRRLIKPDHDE